MKNSYLDLIDQSYGFPQSGFNLDHDYLTFNGISLKKLIEKHGTPFRLTYLPKIGEQIQNARTLFNQAIEKNNYTGNYNFCYCTKVCHFHHVVSAALKEGVNLETSSAFDIDLIQRLYKKGELDKRITIIHNGHKTDEYIQKVLQLQEEGFHNSIIILDSVREIDRVQALLKGRTIDIGIRMAIEKEPQNSYYTSRLGIRSSQLIETYQSKLKDNPHFNLKMVHFFVDSGIKDSLYYWGEFQKGVKIYTELKRVCPELDSLNIGGGFPIRNQLGFDYDYAYMIQEIVKRIKANCQEAKVDDPNIFTEFGKYTVGEAGATVFEVIEHKRQNDKESWYIVNNSLMNTIPDAWSINEKFILLPINKWNKEYVRANIGGISCDQSDYYNSEDFNQQILLPKIEDESNEPLYVGFFHTGAYQDAISGYGGIKHCLIPSPKHVVVDKDENGDLVDYVYRNEQTVDQMMSILGYE